MPNNISYIKTLPGSLKCVSIGFITVTMALSFLGSLNSNYMKNRNYYKYLFIGEHEVSLWREYCLMAVSTLGLIFSISGLAIQMCSRDIYRNRKTAICDFLFHTCTFLLLSTSGIFNIVSAVKLFEINCTNKNECQLFEVKFAAGGIAVITSILYGALAAIVLTNRKEVERDALQSETK